MKFSIGFNSSTEESVYSNLSAETPENTAEKSLVRVYFPERNMTLSYYNDMFDLKRGDIVYVEGKLEGLRGRVVDVSLSFKIKLADYKRVIGLADIDIKGKLYPEGSHLVTFDFRTLPYSKVISWFRPPENEEEYVSGTDSSYSFSLNDLSGMKIGSEIAERGHDYYTRNRVRYICLEGIKGRAIVEGSHAYEVEFEYRGGEIRNLVCGCFCAYPCKHEFAAMLQLKEMLEKIDKDHFIEFKENSYFAAVDKASFFSFAVDGKSTGCITLD